MWGCQMDFDHPEVTALEGINAFRNFLIGLGMPKNFEELGAKEEDIPLLVKTLNLNGNTLGGIMPLNEADVEAIYRSMGDS